jgi:hypothetical protein
MAAPARAPRISGPRAGVGLASWKTGSRRQLRRKRGGWRPRSTSTGAREGLAQAQYTAVWRVNPRVAKRRNRIHERSDCLPPLRTHTTCPRAEGMVCNGGLSHLTRSDAQFCVLTASPIE